MSSIKLNDNHDIDLTGNNMSLVSGPDEYRQKIIQRLKMFLGEWFLDESRGIPYIDSVFEKGTPANEIESVFIEQILSVQGVIRMLKFDIEFSTNRELSLDFTVQTLSGTLNVNEVI